MEVPAIEIRAIPNTTELDEAVLNLDKYQWIVFTSFNGVEAFFQRLHTLNLDARSLKGIKIGTIGPATAQALKKYGLRPDYLPEDYSSCGFVTGLNCQNIMGCRFLLPRADIANRELAQAIASMGVEVHEVTAYKTITPNETVSRGKQMLLAGKIDVVTFTSPSTVINLLDLLGDERQTIERANVACIGPKTAAAAEQAGLRVDIVAQEYTIPGLVEAIERYFKIGKKEI
jgi:uroporphyrinogen III methyltransferase/synthase